MQVKWGPYTRPQNEGTLIVRMAGVDDSLGNRVSETWNITVRGTIHGEGLDDAAIHANVTTQRLELEAMARLTRQNFYFLDDNGSTIIHQLLVNQCITGPRITNLIFDEGRGTYVNWLPYTLEIEGVKALQATAGKNLIQFNEQITIRGNGGPEYIIKTPRNAKPIKQLVSLYSMVYAVQSGSATGNAPYPVPSNPIWREHLVNPEEEVTLSYADRKYTVSWNYRFESIGPLQGVPNLP